MPKPIVWTLIIATAAGILPPARSEPQSGHDMHMTHEPSTAQAADSRVLVHFPENLRTHTLANMRDHLRTLQAIQEALAHRQYDQAGDIAEQRLGMASLKMHGAHEVAPYMPEQMQAIGSEMHRAASRFAVLVKDTAVTGDVNPALAQLSRVTEQCVACHDNFRLQ